MSRVAQRREFADLLDLEAPSNGWRADSRSRRVVGSDMTEVDLEELEMFNIGQRVICVDDKFVGENRVFDPTFTVRCPNLPVKGDVYTVRAFVVPYAGYPGTPGILLEEIINPPCPYFEGTFEPSFFPSHFRPLSERKADISVFTAMLNKTPEKV